MVGKKELISNINNITSYAVLYFSVDVLCKGLSGSSVIKRVSFISKKTKSHAHRYIKTMKKGINLVFHAQVVIKYIAVKVTKLGSVPI